MTERTQKVLRIAERKPEFLFDHHALSVHHNFAFAQLPNAITQEELARPLQICLLDIWNLIETKLAEKTKETLVNRYQRSPFRFKKEPPESLAYLFYALQVYNRAAADKGVETPPFHVGNLRQQFRNIVSDWPSKAEIDVGESIAKVDIPQLVRDCLSSLQRKRPDLIFVVRNDDYERAITFSRAREAVEGGSTIHMSISLGGMTLDPSRARGWESFCAKLSVAMTVPQASSRGFLDRDDRTGEFSRETGLTRISRQTAFTKSTLVDPDSRDAESLRSAMSEEPDILQRSR